MSETDQPWAENCHPPLLKLRQDKSVRLRRLHRLAKHGGQGITNYELGKTNAAKSMKEAVRIAARNAKKGDYVVLSPGATSFSTFLNEFDRGNAFVAAVRALR